MRLWCVWCARSFVEGTLPPRLPPRIRQSLMYPVATRIIEHADSLVDFAGHEADMVTDSARERGLLGPAGLQKLSATEICGELTNHLQSR